MTEVGGLVGSQEIGAHLREMGVYMGAKGWEMLAYMVAKGGNEAGGLRMWGYTRTCELETSCCEGAKSWK